MQQSHLLINKSSDGANPPPPNVDYKKVKNKEMEKYTLAKYKRKGRTRSNISVTQNLIQDNKRKIFIWIKFR